MNKLILKCKSISPNLSKELMAKETNISSDTKRFMNKHKLHRIV